MAEEKTIILKTDVLGRVTMPKEKREAILDEFEKSGMPAERFSRVHGIKVKTFASWVQKRRRSRGELPTRKRRKVNRKLALVEAVVEAKAQVLKVELANGVRLEVSDRNQLPLVAELVNIFQ